MRPDYERGLIHTVKRDFSTAIPDLAAAREWVTNHIRNFTRPGELQRGFHFTIEATACYHFPVLNVWGGEPAVVNPNLLKAGRRKTDDIDSANLAEMDLEGRWPTSYVYPPEQQAFRVLLRAHHLAARAAARWGTRINTQLLKFGITAGRLGSLRDRTIRPSVEDLMEGREVLDPEFLACVPEEHVPLWLRPLIVAGYEQADAEHARALALWREIQHRSQEINFWLGGTYQPAKRGMELLQTMPGFGDLTAAWLLAEIGDVRRFPTANALAAWAGCDLSVRVSAGKVTSYARRRGHGHVHWLLIQAGNVAIRGDSPLGAWGRARIQKGGKGAKQRAVGAVARRMIGHAYWMLLRLEFCTFSGVHR